MLVVIVQKFQCKLQAVLLEVLSKSFHPSKDVPSFYSFSMLE